MDNWIKDFVNLIYPDTCVGCEMPLATGESIVCINCYMHLPHTNMHKTMDTELRDLFYTRIPVHGVASLFYYEKIGSVQRMIHELKYRGRQEVSTFIGQWLASMILEYDHFNTVDMVVPVPVHPKRLRQRGYNQVMGFGIELANVLRVRFRESVLKKTINTKKQAQLNQTQRIDETNSPYQLAAEILPGTHVLLVDDIVTTGTTLVLCARELLKVPDVKVSIATMAMSV